MIPEDDLDLTAYLNELLKTKKPEHQNNTVWFPTPEDPGKPLNHNPIQTWILRGLIELKEKENLNPEDGTKSQTKFPERFDWTDTLLTETNN